MPHNEPWYQSGLRFECRGCGACCTGAPGHVWVTNAEVELLAEDLGMEVDEFERKYVRRGGIRKSLVEFPNGDCVFFERPAMRCKVYRARPRQCRTWPFWPSNLRSPQNWADMAERCPGANRGPLIEPARIQSAADERSDL